MSGFLMHKMDSQMKMFKTIGIVLLLVPAIVALFWHKSMQCTGRDVLPYYIVALIGSLGVVCLSRILSQSRLSGVLSYIGDKTLYILIFHFLAFKLVSLVYIEYCHLQLGNLAQFPVLPESNLYLWIIYSLTGIGISILMWELLHNKTLHFKSLRHK